MKAIANRKKKCRWWISFQSNVTEGVTNCHTITISGKSMYYSPKNQHNTKSIDLLSEIVTIKKFRCFHHSIEFNRKPVMGQNNSNIPPNLSRSTHSHIKTNYFHEICQFPIETAENFQTYCTPVIGVSGCHRNSLCTDILQHKKDKKKPSRSELYFNRLLGFRGRRVWSTSLLVTSGNMGEARPPKELR